MLLFMFYNVTNHLVYAKNVLQISNINKGSRGQQLFLQPRWYSIPNREAIAKEICELQINPITGQSF